MRREPSVIVKAALYLLVFLVMAALVWGFFSLFQDSDEPCTASRPVEECIF